MNRVELAERCEASTGPDRDIDKAIAWGGARIRDEDLAPRYTRSLDAAMTLVPKGLYPGVGQHSPAHWQANVTELNKRTWAGSGVNAALALTAAALRAQAAQGTEAQRAETENTGSVHDGPVTK